MPPRIQVPTAADVAQDRERLQTRRTLLFRPSSSSSPPAAAADGTDGSNGLATRPALPPPAAAPARPASAPAPAPAEPQASRAVVPIGGGGGGGAAVTTVAAPTNAILVSKKQDGNPVLRHIRNVRWEWGAIVPDFVVGASACALFLSLKYHRLHPAYVTDRIRELKADFTLRLLICLVDVDDPGKTLNELNTMCVITKFTLILAWSNEEVARYLETYKAYELKSADAIKGRANADFVSVMTDALTSIRSVNKTDVVTLLTQFGSLKNIMNATKEQLALCPGFGEQKAKRLHDAFREPFIADKKRRLERLEQQEAARRQQHTALFGPLETQD